METFREDLKYLSKVAHLPRPPPKVSRVGLHLSRRGGTSSRERTLRYFSDLTWEQKSHLMQFYALDFEAFGYDPNPYLLMT